MNESFLLEEEENDRRFIRHGIGDDSKPVCLLRVGKHTTPLLGYTVVSFPRCCIHIISEAWCSICRYRTGTLGRKARRMCFSPFVSTAILGTVNVNRFFFKELEKRKPDGRSGYRKREQSKINVLLS